MNASQFFAGFWPNLAADLVIGLLFTFVIAKVIEANKKVSAVIDCYYFEKDGVLQFSLSNYSSYYLKSGEAFYCLYISESILSDIDSEEAKAFDIRLAQKGVEINHKKYIRVDGVLTTNCFTRAKVGLARIKINPASINRKDILFYLNTVYGAVPKRAAMKKPGFINFKKLGTVVVEKL